MADQISGCDSQRRVRGGFDLVIAAPAGLVFNFGVNVARGARHVARAHGLAAGGFHRFIQLTRNALGGGVFRVGRPIVVFDVQRDGVGRATCQKHLVTGHTAADLRQTHLFAGHARWVDRVGHVQFWVVGHHFCGFGQRLFERISGVVVWFFHCS